VCILSPLEGEEYRTGREWQDVLVLVRPHRSRVPARLLLHPPHPNPPPPVGRELVIVPGGRELVIVPVGRELVIVRGEGAGDRSLA
jgi:hypothetical protein